jgi:rhodanese-related sulfurtransferase
MKSKGILIALATACAIGMAAPQLTRAEEAFPLRAKFPTVKPISTEALATDYAAATIVDVRSQMEFDVVHIGKALYIPVSNADFLKQLEAKTKRNGKGPLVFYCNGIHCAKSYEAADHAQEAGFKNVFCYDAGVLEWTKRYPDKASLLGKTPAPVAKLIAKADFEKHKLAFADFKARAASKEAIVIDMRDPAQRVKEAHLPQSKEVLLPGVRGIPGDRLVELLKKQEFKGKTLLIFDAVGKQVQWLQYYLEDNGYSDYFFLKEGVLTAVEAGAVK